MKNFALIGIGYIAEKHLRAIKETGNELLAALDPHDSVGILDEYFPNCEYFSDHARFERHIAKAQFQNTSNKIDFFSICSPNYLHDSHIRLALNSGANVICEKPLVINPWNLDLLEKLEETSKLSIFTVLQLRLHPEILKLKKEQQLSKTKKDITLSYISARGKWYQHSWKGNIEKSGGILVNIGIHFFDMLLWIYGPVKHFEVYEYSDIKASGYLELASANVKWFLSIDKSDLPKNVIEQNNSTYRSITIDNKELEFSQGFKNLHTEVYREIFLNGGNRISESRPSIELVYKLKNEKISTSIDKHPFSKK
ncbi:MAG TPA: Gfo/Idh/MocA family oxidoreductase [Saprospiraceae bacterium]|nr:Gfo/Idh/MocA family oxidoreductase [Saprospiraceae bacterium]